MPEYDDNEKELEPTAEDLALAEDIALESDLEDIDDDDGVNDADDEDSGEFLGDDGLLY
jgi:hypothetical protein